MSIESGTEARQGRDMRGRDNRQKLDYSEVSQLLRAGWTQQQVADKFGTTQGAVSLAKRRGNVEGGPIYVRSDMPWKIRPEHMSLHLPKMLRANARREAGESLGPSIGHLLDAFLASMKELDAVVHYEPEVSPYFFRVARRPGIDTSLVRDPSYDDLGRRVQRRK